MIKKRITLAHKDDAYNFSVGITMMLDDDGLLVPLTWWRRLLCRWGWITTRFHSRSMITNVDNVNGTITVKRMRWSWLKWKWVRL
jgi:hypothetical protein